MFESFTWGTFLIGCLTGLLSTFMAFMVTIVLFSRNCLKISSKITRGVNTSVYKKDMVAWKFKIVNKSPFLKLYNIDTKLIGIKYVKNADGTYTEHRKKIDCIAGVRLLGCYNPAWIVWIKRKINPKYTIDYDFRPLTFEDLDNANYDDIELSVIYSDSLMGWTHVAIKKFSNTIQEGEFSNDGKLNYIIPQKISEIAWNNHRQRIEEEIENAKKAEQSAQK